MQAVLKAEINKTDRNDARGIAQMMRVGVYRPVHATQPETADAADPSQAIAVEGLKWTRHCHHGQSRQPQVGQPPPDAQGRWRQAPGYPLVAMGWRRS
jgi:hypothetical protein